MNCFSLHVECMVYGNCTADSAMKIYTGLVDKLKQQCNTRLVAPLETCLQANVPQSTATLAADKRT